jgi:hypothetical protein
LFFENFFKKQEDFLENQCRPSAANFSKLPGNERNFWQFSAEFRRIIGFGTQLILRQTGLLMKKPGESRWHQTTGNWQHVVERGCAYNVLGVINSHAENNRLSPENEWKLKSFDDSITISAGGYRMDEATTFRQFLFNLK